MKITLSKKGRERRGARTRECRERNYEFDKEMEEFKLLKMNLKLLKWMILKLFKKREIIKKYKRRQVSDKKSW